MGDETIKRKELLGYISFRSALLRVQMRCVIESAPKEQQELVKQRYTGRLRELDRLEKIIEANTVKKMNKKYKKRLKKINGEE